MNYIDGTEIKKITKNELNYLSGTTSNIQTQLLNITENGSGEKIFFYNNNQTLENKSQITLFTITTDKTVTLPDVILNNGKKITIYNSSSSSGNLSLITTSNQTIIYSDNQPIILYPSKNIILLSNGTEWYATQSSSSSNNTPVSEILYTYTTSQTLNSEQQIAIFNLTNASIATLPLPSINDNKKITIINTYNSLNKLTINGNINSNTDNSVILLPSQNIIFMSDGSQWFIISNQTNVLSLLKSSRSVNSYINDISNNIGLNIGDYITFDDSNVYLIGADISKNSNNKSFNLSKGKIYEITFNAINHSSNLYSIFEIVNYDTNTFINNNYNDVNFSDNDKPNIFFVDLSTYQTNINIGIRVKYTNADNNNKLILGFLFESNYILPNISIKNISGGNLQITSYTNNITLTNPKISGNLYPLDNNNTQITTITPNNISHLNGTTSNIQTQLTEKANLNSNNLWNGIEVTPTQISYLNTTTSNIQTQITNKLDISNNTTINSNIITPTNISYLSGTTSNIQSQISTKLDISNNTTINSNIITPANISYLSGTTSNIQSQISTKLDISNNTIINSDTITPTNISYLSGTNSNIQTQITNKLDISNNTIINSNTITPTNISHLSGTTSNIQTQLTGKANLNSNNSWGGTEVSPANIGFLHGLDKNVQGFFNNSEKYFHIKPSTITNEVATAYYIQFTPITFMIYFIHMKDSDNQTYTFPIPFNNVWGAQITKNNYVTTANTGGSLSPNSPCINSLTTTGISIDSVLLSSDKSSCHVIVYGSYNSIYNNA